MGKAIQIEITIPESMDEITLEQYQKFMKLITDNPDAKTDFIDHKTIEIMCNADLKSVARMRYNTVKEISDHLAQVFSTAPELVPTFTLDGVEYGFIPKLDDMTLGEYVDLDMVFGDWEKMHKALAVLYRPVTKKYKNEYLIEEYEGYDKTEDIMKRAPLSVALGCMVFFYSLNNELLKIMMSYLHQEVSKDTQLQKTLEQNGVGTNHFMAWQTETFNPLLPLQK